MKINYKDFGLLNKKHWTVDTENYVIYIEANEAIYHIYDYKKFKMYYHDRLNSLDTEEGIQIRYDTTNDLIKI